MLLLSTSNQASLILRDISPTGYIAPEAMVVSLDSRGSRSNWERCRMYTLVVGGVGH